MCSNRECIKNEGTVRIRQGLLPIHHHEQVRDGGLIGRIHYMTSHLPHRAGERAVGPGGNHIVHCSRAGHLVHAIANRFIERVVFQNGQAGLAEVAIFNDAVQDEGYGDRVIQRIHPLHGIVNIVQVQAGDFINNRQVEGLASCQGRGYGHPESHSCGRLGRGS